MTLFLFLNCIEYRNKNFRRNVHEIENDFLRIFVARENESSANDSNNTKKIKGKNSWNLFMTLSPFLLSSLFIVDESFNYETAVKDREFKREMQQQQRTLYFQKEL